MKRKTLFGAGLLTVLAALTFTACYHKSPENRIGWMIEEVSDRLSLDAGQRERLDAMAEEILARRKQMHANHEALREIVMGELRKEHIDRSVIDGLVAEKRRQMDEMIDYLEDGVLAFHEMLTPEQREKLVAELEKLHARTEKYGHHRW
ncbi:MAG: periplasmic heavy metal sensor [Pseudomonadota bacterium]